jgi:hypothetical protein
VSLEAAIVTSLTFGVIVAAIGHDRGRGLWEVFLLLTRLDEMVIDALFRPEAFKSIVADRLHGIRLGEPDVAHLEEADEFIAQARSACTTPRWRCFRRYAGGFETGHPRVPRRVMTGFCVEKT